MVLQKYSNDEEDDEEDEEEDEEESDDASDDKEGNEAEESESSDDDDDDDEEGKMDQANEDNDGGKTGTLEPKSESDARMESEKSTPEKSLSRRSKKRLEKYAETKSKRRAAERERRKRRAAETRDMQEKDPDADVECFGHKKKRLKQNKMKNSSCKLRIAFDCSYDDLMGEKDIPKLCKELQSAYTVNRRLIDPLQLYLTSLDGKSRIKEMFEKVYQGSTNWDIHSKSEALKEVFSPDEIVYLTSESENVLDKLDESKVYVIGGLSDQDRLKGHCHRTAAAAGFAHARLPIEEHVETPTCRVLTVSRVFRAIASVTTNGGDWAKALEAVMPRKRDAPVAVGEGGKGGAKRLGVDGKRKRTRTKRGGKKHRKDKRQGTSEIETGEVSVPS